MGQQQLLIVILVTIIVGIVSLLAVTTFDSAAKAANRDAVVNDLTTLASSAQDYYLRPGLLAGGGRSFSGFVIQGKLLPVSGISTTGEFAQTENGTLEIRSVTTETITIVAHPSSCDGYIPGSVDEEGVLTDPGSCTPADEISATVGVNEITF